jgi:hypothetical protein
MPESLDLKMVVISRYYGVEIPVDDFLALSNAESIMSEGPLCDNSLCQRFSDVPGVFDVEYNGHLGSSIYFRLDDEFDYTAIHEQILEIIKDQIIKARKASWRPSRK